MRRAFPLFLLSTLASGTGLLHAQVGQQALGSYVVRIEPSPALRARITLTVPGAVPAGRLRMASGAINHLPDRWGSFLREIRLTSGTGQPLEARSVRDSLIGATWPIAASPSGLRLSYDVDLSFAQSDWPPGNEQAGYWADSALFVVTKALFLAPDVPGAWRVRFELPTGWRASTPWTPTPGNDHEFLVDNWDMLSGNSIVVGRHSEFRFASGGLDVRLALLGDATRGASEVRQVLQPIMRSYERLFAGSPSERHLMTIFYGSNEDGEGFESSSAFRTTVPLVRDTRIVWANHVAHELLHTWIGHGLRGADGPTSEWFNEGFTEYLSNLTLVRTGAISAAEFMRKAEHHMSLYSYFRNSGIYDTVTVVESGRRKYRHRFGVYNGGWAVAFALDRELLRRAAGARRLDDLLQLLYREHAVRGVPWTMDDLIRRTGEVAGSDMRVFFDAYVIGREYLPLQREAAALGWRLIGQDYAAEMYLLEDREATPAQLAERRRFLAAPQE